MEDLWSVKATTAKSPMVLGGFCGCVANVLQIQSLDGQ